MFIRVNTFKQYMGLALSCLILISPFTFFGDNIVACINSLGNVVHIELLHSPHFIPLDSESPCDHQDEEHALTYQCHHEHDKCLDVPLSAKIILQKDKNFSLNKQYFRLLSLSRSINEPEYHMPGLSKFYERNFSYFSNAQIIRSTVLLC